MIPLNNRQKGSVLDLTNNHKYADLEVDNFEHRIMTNDIFKKRFQYVNDDGINLYGIVPDEEYLQTTGEWLIQNIDGIRNMVAYENGYQEVKGGIEVVGQAKEDLYNASINAYYEALLEINKYAHYKGLYKKSKLNASDSIDIRNIIHMDEGINGNNSIIYNLISDDDFNKVKGFDKKELFLHMIPRITEGVIRADYENNGNQSPISHYILFKAMDIDTEKLTYTLWTSDIRFMGGICSENSIAYHVTPDILYKDKMSNPYGIITGTFNGDDIINTMSCCESVTTLVQAMLQDDAYMKGCSDNGEIARISCKLFHDCIAPLYARTISLDETKEHYLDSLMLSNLSIPINTFMKVNLLLDKEREKKAENSSYKFPSQKKIAIAGNLNMNPKTKLTLGGIDIISDKKINITKTNEVVYRIPEWNVSGYVNKYGTYVRPTIAHRQCLRDKVGQSGVPQKVITIKEEEKEYEINE